jgi:hypothetical protein
MRHANRFRRAVCTLCGGAFLLLTSVLAPSRIVHAQTAAADIPIGVTYICSGEHIYIENCDMRDPSDNANCMVAHPDHLTPTGMNSYTYVSRGALKKLLPTCQQPSAQQLAAARAFQKRQQDIYNANVQKSEEQMKAATQPVTLGQPQKPKTQEERQMARCVSSGRLPASCTGNSLLGAFSQMVSSVLPSTAAKDPQPGPNMAGVFQGAGNWRLDFIDGGVLVNCAFLSPNQENYSLKFESNRTLLIIDTRPKPLELTFRADGTITGPGPVTINGVVASGYVPGKTAAEKGTQRDDAGHYYDSMGNRLSDDPGYTSFAPRTATCPALNLTSKGASVGAQTMQTDLLKTMFGGDKGPPTPPGIRMHGIYAASTGFSVQFFPESVILGCGPDAARAYPYTVVADGARAVVHIDAPDHPLTLAFRPDGSLDPGGSGPYQVHGRVVTGQNDNDDITFTPLEQSCNLAVLAPSKTIPASGGSGALTTAGTGNGPGSSNAGGGLSTPAAPLGNATLTIVSGFLAQPGQPNPLAGRPYVILRDSYGDALAKGGVAVPAGTSPYKYVGGVCGSRTPECQQALDAIKANAASAVRADASGAGTLPGVPPGTYYLMVSAIYNKQSLVWGQAVHVNAGQNSVTLDLRNAMPLN